MSNFTPGPWEMVLETEESDGAMVLGAAPHVGPTAKKYVAYHMSDADARLISASPELLAACRNLLGCLEDWCEIADDDDQREDDHLAIAAAKAAISKAEGVMA